MNRPAQANKKPLKETFSYPERKQADQGSFEDGQESAVAISQTPHYHRRISILHSF